MSIAGYIRQQEAYQQMLQDEAKRIADSTEARAWLNKNVGYLPAEECLKVALRCIGNLTGDYTASKNFRRQA